MSRSKPTSSGTASPIKYRFEFSGKTGKFTYYDKETKKNVEVDDLKLIILDMRSSFTGFSDDENAGIYSNMVSNITKEEMVVKAGSKTIATGLYADIKDKVEKKGGKYSRDLISLAYINKEWVMSSLSLTKSALATFMNFEKGKDDNGDDLEEGKPDLMDSILLITAGANKKKGSIKYVVPAFELAELSQELSDLAMEQDVLLQDYFNGRSTSPAAESTPSEPEEGEPEAEEPQAEPATGNTGNKKKKLPF